MRGVALRACALLATFMLGADAPAHAQGTDDYWDALRAETSASIVLAATAPAGVPEPLAEGLRLFRAYEVSDDEGAARRARELLRRARVAPEHRAWHALALAMVYARGPDSRLRLDGGRGFVTDPNSLGSARSLRLLRDALATRPHFREAALELATWALDREHALVAAEAEIALAALPEDGVVLLARARLNLLMDQPALAAELAARAQMLGAEAALARHTRAWALFQLQASAAEARELYFLGARDADAAGRREYERFLAPLLTTAELDDWHATPDDSLADWLRRYWQRNAARAGVLPEERLAEHYRRVHRARIDFPNASPLSVLQIQAPFVLGEDTRGFGMSLRGLMLVRHGDPYRLANIERCLANPWPGQGGATICAELGRSRTAIMQSAAELAHGDSYFPFIRPLELYYGVYAFRGAANTNDVVFAIGLPARSANALVAGPQGTETLLSTVLLDDSGSYVRRDTILRMPARAFNDPLAGQTDAVTLLFSVMQVPAEDAARDFRATVSDVARYAGGIASGSMALHRFDGLALSDVVVAPEGMAGLNGWRRGDVDVGFAPLAQYRAGETIALYYEVYGLAADASYRTEIELAPPVDGLRERLLDLVRDRSIRFRFEGVADPPHAVFGLQQNRTIRLENVEPGLWTLRVVVTELATGERSERETVVEIVE